METSTGQGPVAVLCSWEDNRRSSVALAMRHSLSATSTDGLNDPRKADEHPAFTPLASFILYFYHSYLEQSASATVTSTSSLPILSGCPKNSPLITVFTKFSILTTVVEYPCSYWIHKTLNFIFINIHASLSRTMVMSGDVIDLMMFGALRCVRPCSTRSLICQSNTLQIMSLSTVLY